MMELRQTVEAEKQKVLGDFKNKPRSKNTKLLLKPRKNNGVHIVAKKPFFIAVGTRHTVTIRVSKPIGHLTCQLVLKTKPTRTRTEMTTTMVPLVTHPVPVQVTRPFNTSWLTHKQDLMGEELRREVTA